MQRQQFPTPVAAVQGNCDDHAPASSLNLTAADASRLLPLKPRQCVLVVDDTWLMVNGGTVWLDNLYLMHARYGGAFLVSDLPLHGREFNLPLAPGADVSVAAYVTGVTFHASPRSRMSAVVMRRGYTAVLLNGTTPGRVRHAWDRWQVPLTRTSHGPRRCVSDVSGTRRGAPAE